MAISWRDSPLVFRRIESLTDARKIHRASIYGIVACTHGLGTPDSQLDPALAYTTRGLEYLVWWEVSYLTAAGIIKASIGVAVIRIALERRYRYTIYALVFLSSAACVGGIIWELAACRPISTRWNIYAGSCVVPGLLQISYAITAMTVITDAGFALVPILILRRLSMVPRIKYSLMFVLALGSVAALAAVCRYPFLGYFGAEHNYLCKRLLGRTDAAVLRDAKGKIGPVMLTMLSRQQRLDSALVRD